MKDKEYYVPTIEEFHAGFEYELVPSAGWAFVQLDENDEPRKTRTIWASEFKKGIFGVQDVNFFGDNLATLRAAIQSAKVRVKYLDKEDIEDLGFEPLGHGWYHKEQDVRLRIWREHEYDIYKDLTRKLEDEDIREFLVFRGVIRNKAELVKLLRQLKINITPKKDS